MGYDIYFVRRDPGQSFEEALEVVEESYDGEPGPLTSVELDQWERILPRAREILGEVQVSGGDTTRELIHEPSGIELTLLRDQASITVPFEHPGVDAVEVMGQVYELARAIEAETGLEGYDPQLGEPVTENRESIADSRFPTSAGNGSSDGPAGGAGAAETRDGQPSAEPTVTTAGPRRRWWEFWKR